MLKLKLLYFGHLRRRVNSLEKTLILGKIEGRRRRGWQRMGWWMASLTQWASVQFSRSVMSDSLPPHESQHARLPCPSPTPGVHSKSRPLSQWWTTGKTMALTRRTSVGKVMSLLFNMLSRLVHIKMSTFNAGLYVWLYGKILHFKIFFYWY